MNNTTAHTSGPKVQSAREFIARDIPMPVDLVEGLINPGVSLIAGAPKVGKSLLTLQLAHAVAGGMPFLGHTTRQGPTMYVNLEGSEASLSARIRQLLTEEDRTDFDIVTEPDQVPPLGGGLERWVDEEISKRKLRLLVIDTLTRVMPADGGHPGHSQYHRDAKILERLVTIANRHPDTSIIFVTHSRETHACDALDAIYGSRGLTATINGALVLSRFDDIFGGDDDATHRLSVRLRDGDDSAPPLALKQRGTTFNSMGRIRVTDRLNIRDMILETLQDSKEALRAKHIASETGEKPGSVRKTLMRMVDARRLCKYGPWYWLPGHPPPACLPEPNADGTWPALEMELVFVPQTADVDQ